MPRKLKPLLDKFRVDRGLTLIELLVVMVVLGVIGGAITNSVVEGLKFTNLASNFLGESHDTQLVSSYFVSDAESAELVATTASLDCPPPASPTVVRFEWTDPRDSALKVASYYLDLTGSQRSLKRFYCEIRQNPDPNKDPIKTEDLSNIAHYLAIKATGLPSEFLPPSETNPHLICLDAAGGSVDCGGLVKPTTVIIRLFSCVLDDRAASPDKGDCRRDSLPADRFPYRFELRASRRPS